MIPGLLIVCHLLSIIQCICLGVTLLYISISGFNSNGMTDLTKCYMLKDLEGRTVILNSSLSKYFLTLSQKTLAKFL